MTEMNLFSVFVWDFRFRAEIGAAICVRAGGGNASEELKVGGCTLKIVIERAHKTSAPSNQQWSIVMA